MTWHETSAAAATMPILYNNNMNTPIFVNALLKLCTVKRTWTGCPVWPLMMSVLLLLWTLAACRGLWRGRYVDLNSSLFFWLDVISVCPLGYGIFQNFFAFLCFTDLTSRERQEFLSFRFSLSSMWRNAVKDWEMLSDGYRPTGSCLLLLFFAWMCPARGGGRSRW